MEVDDTGDEPRFRIFARSGKYCSPLVDAAFVDSSVAVGKWSHVAISYDPFVGRGTWTLRVDGNDAGAVENLWRDDSLSGASDTFVLGNYCDSLVNGFGGGYDVWRVSKGFVATDELLWQPGGLVILVK